MGTPIGEQPRQNPYNKDAIDPDWGEKGEEARRRKEEEAREEKEARRRKEEEAREEKEARRRKEEEAREEKEARRRKEEEAMLRMLEGILDVDELEKSLENNGGIDIKNLMKSLNNIEVGDLISAVSAKDKDKIKKILRKMLLRDTLRNIEDSLEKQNRTKNQIIYSTINTITGSGTDSNSKISVVNSKISVVKTKNGTPVLLISDPKTFVDNFTNDKMVIGGGGSSTHKSRLAHFNKKTGSEIYMSVNTKHGPVMVLFHNTKELTRGESKKNSERTGGQVNNKLKNVEDNDEIPEEHKAILRSMPERVIQHEEGHALEKIINKRIQEQIQMKIDELGNKADTFSTIKLEVYEKLQKEYKEKSVEQEDPDIYFNRAMGEIYAILHSGENPDEVTTPDPKPLTLKQVYIDNTVEKETIENISGIIKDVNAIYKNSGENPRMRLGLQNSILSYIIETQYGLSDAKDALIEELNQIVEDNGLKTEDIKEAEDPDANSVRSMDQNIQFLDVAGINSATNLDLVGGMSDIFGSHLLGPIERLRYYSIVRSSVMARRLRDAGINNFGEFIRAKKHWLNELGPGKIGPWGALLRKLSGADPAAMRDLEVTGSGIFESRLGDYWARVFSESSSNAEEMVDAAAPLTETQHEIATTQAIRDILAEIGMNKGQTEEIITETLHIDKQGEIHLENVDKNHMVKIINEINKMFIASTAPDIESEIAKLLSTIETIHPANVATYIGQRRFILAASESYSADEINSYFTQRIINNLIRDKLISGLPANAVSLGGEPNQVMTKANFLTLASTAARGSYFDDLLNRYTTNSVAINRLLVSGEAISLTTPGTSFDTLITILQEPRGTAVKRILYGDHCTALHARHGSDGKLHLGEAIPPNTSGGTRWDGSGFYERIDGLEDLMEGQNRHLAQLNILKQLIEGKISLKAERKNMYDRLSRLTKSMRWIVLGATLFQAFTSPTFGIPAHMPFSIKVYLITIISSFIEFYGFKKNGKVAKLIIEELIKLQSDNAKQILDATESIEKGMIPSQIVAGVRQNKVHEIQKAYSGVDNIKAKLKEGDLNGVIRLVWQAASLAA